MEKAEFNVGSRNLTFRKSGSHYSIRFNAKALPTKASRQAGLKFKFSPLVSGDHIELLDAFMLYEAIADLIEGELRKTLYLGPFRQPPQRRYPTRGSAPLEVGAQGESAVTLLANEYVQSKARPHIKEVSKWMAELGLAKKVDVSRVGKSDLFDVQVTLQDGASLPIADLGYGMSQILPVLVQCSFAQPGSILLFEQPELHLHHAAARKLASVLVKAAREKNLKIIAETHSEDMFLQILSELNNKHLPLEEVCAYEVERRDGKSHFKKIEINEHDGKFECTNPWKKGISET